MNDYTFVSVALTWGLPAIILNKIVFFIIYKTTGGHECIVDVAYSISHLVAGVVYFIFSSLDAYDRAIKLILVGMWALRLGGFLCYTRVLQGYKDPRYDKIFEEYDSNKFKKDLMVFVQFMFQGLIVFVTSLPLFWLFQNSLEWGDNQGSNYHGVKIMNYIALCIIPFSIFLEGTADCQLENYKNLKKTGAIPPEDLLETGLWKKSRHPNLFFDLVTWFCFTLAAISADNLYSLFSFFGPVALFLVMDQLTTPLTDGYMKKKRGEAYDLYCQRTNKYLPF